MELDVRLVEVFTNEQRGTLIMGDAGLSLAVSGLRYHRLPGYEQRNPGPFLSLHPPLEEVTFDFGPDRENWVVLFGSSDLRRGSRDGLVAVRGGAGDPWIEMPKIVELPTEAVPALQQDFMRLRETFRSPLATDRLRVHVGVLSLIGRCLGGAPAPAATDPAAKLRRLLDDDPLGRHSIAALSRRCGLSADHLRLRFQRAYGLAPLAYRQRQRLAEAIRLLTTTELPIGGIAKQLGFRHASHFCAVFRAHFGQTPVSSRRRFRYGG